MYMRHMFRQKAMLALALMAALGVEVALTTTLAAAAEVVVVYTAQHQGKEPVFEAFTKQTGIEMQSFDGSPWNSSNASGLRVIRRQPMC